MIANDLTCAFSNTLTAWVVQDTRSFPPLRHAPFFDPSEGEVTPALLEEAYWDMVESAQPEVKPPDDA